MNQPLHEWRENRIQGYERELAELKALVEEAVPWVHSYEERLNDPEGGGNHVTRAILSHVGHWLTRADQELKGRHEKEKEP